MRKGSAIATLAFTSLLACGQPANVPDAAGDASVDARGDAAPDALSDDAGDATIADTTQRDSAADADARMPAADAPTACNTLAQMGSAVTASCRNTAAPTPRGGTIVPGTYVMTAGNIYSPDTSCPAVDRRFGSLTARVSATTVQFAQIDGTDGTPSAVTFSYTTTGTTITLTQTCPVTDHPPDETYTATATQLHLFVDLGTATTEQVFTLR